MGQVWWLRTHSDILQSSCDAKVLALFMVRQFQCEPLWTMQHHMCRKGTVQCCKFRSPLALLGYHSMPQLSEICVTIQGPLQPWQHILHASIPWQLQQLQLQSGSAVFQTLSAA